MARGIQDIANNLGFVYMTEVNGSTIITSQPNSAVGVRNMRDLGSSVAPFAAQRAAYGILEVTTAAATGNVTAVTVNGVNQIGANIPIDSVDTAAAATLIAAGINSFTPGSGPDCVASSFGAFVFIFTPASFGAASNGYAVGYSATGGALVATTTAMAYGSSEGGVYDSVIGRRFFLNANYDANGVSGGQAASPTSLTNAVEITEYMVMRGLQTGIGTVALTVASDALGTVDRFCAIMQLVTTNQGGAPTDNLEFINPAKFVEGDIIFIRSTDVAQALTVVDAANASVSSTPNIYLTDSSNFVIQSNKMLMLRYTFDSTLGGIFVEMSRSVSNSVITLTRGEFIGLKASRSLVPGGSYYITDIGDNGTYVFATNVDAYNGAGVLWRRIPTAYSSCWRADMTIPTMNSFYRYYQNVYESLTGSIGTAPDSDATNWAVVPKTDATHYTTEYHEAGVNVDDANSILWERDLANNFISQSPAHRSASSVNAFNVFAWQPVATGLVYGNLVIDSVFDCANSDGTVYQNTVINNTNFTGNRLQSGSSVNRNVYNQGNIQDNFVTYLTNNIVEKAGFIIGNGAAGAYFNAINKCTVQGAIGYNVSATAGDKSIFNCRVEGQMQFNTLYTDSLISNVFVENGSTCSSGTYRGTLLNATIRNASFLTITQAVAGSISRYLTLESSTVNITYTSNFTLSSFYFRGCTLAWTMNGNSLAGDLTTVTSTFTGTINNSQLSKFTTSGTPTFVFNNDVVVGNESSTMAVTLDLDTGIFAANILTIPSDGQLAGVFNVTGTGAKDIQQVANLPLFKEVRFTNISLGASAVTFTKVAPAAWAVNNIVGAANFVLAQDASGASDMLVMTKLRGVQNTIIQTVKLA